MPKVGAAVRIEFQAGGTTEAARVSGLLLEPPRARLLCVLAHGAVAAAGRALPDLPIVAGGKSLGGRMTSMAAAKAALPGVQGLVLLGFPLHPPKQPGTKRAEHLSEVRIPMLFLQGTRDTLADLQLLRPVLRRLGSRATLEVVEGADHSFKVLKRSGRTDGEVLDQLVRAIVEWAEGSVDRGRDGASVLTPPAPGRS